jgi:hypothetical protein
MRAKPKLSCERSNYIREQPLSSKNRTKHHAVQQLPSRWSLSDACEATRLHRLSASNFRRWPKAEVCGPAVERREQLNSERADDSNWVHPYYDLFLLFRTHELHTRRVNHPVHHREV